MSILLEALRKSEKSKHPQKVPGIHTPDQSGPVSDTMQIGWVALLLVAAMFISGWFIWQQFRPTADDYNSPVTRVKDQAIPVATPEVAQEADDGRVSVMMPPGTTPDDTSGGRRTPVETYQVDANEVGPAESEPQPATRAPSIGKLEETSERPSAGRTLADPDKTEAREKKTRQQQPSVISYWELPDSIRADVQEIKFTVLVYDKQPQARFVLINGERLGEGDSLQPGLVIKNIRRDGVVFSYRLYRFLVEK